MLHLMQVLAAHGYVFHYFLEGVLETADLPKVVLKGLLENMDLVGEIQYFEIPGGGLVIYEA